MTYQRTESPLRKWTNLAPFPEPPLIKLRCPLVLMHGFGMLAAFRRGGIFHETAMNLRKRGVCAFAPNVAPYQTVPVRAKMWKERIEHILDETGTDEVNLVAHSMGGLDARYLIHELGLHTVVASLTTIASPHEGTPLADIVLEQPERLHAWLAGLAHWISQTAMQEASADFTRAVAELTTSYVTGTFNPAVPDHSSVQYWSYSGRAGKGTDIPISPLLRPMNAWLYARDGVNDGFVPEARAHWGTFLGTLDADHTQQVGLDFTIRSRFDASAFYYSLAEHLTNSGL